MDKAELAETLRKTLPGFSGTDGYHRLTLGHQLVATDGVAYLAEKAQCHWLMDVIASYIPRLVKAHERFAVANLTLNGDGGATFTLDNGNHGEDAKHLGKYAGNPGLYAHQRIGYTDFPLPEGIKLYVEDAGEYYVVMLPGEH